VFPYDCGDLDDLTNINIAVATIPTSDPGPRNTTSNSEPKETPEEPRMIGDFDGRSNTLWTLYKDEAKNHDDLRVVSLKDYMDSPLVFVRSYSICT
jgi:hypothetical protein